VRDVRALAHRARVRVVRALAVSMVVMMWRCRRWTGVKTLTGL